MIDNLASLSKARLIISSAISLLSGFFGAEFFTGTFNGFICMTASVFLFLLLSRVDFKSRRLCSVSFIFAAVFSAVMVAGRKIIVETKDFRAFSPIDALYLLVLFLAFSIISYYLFAFLSKADFMLNVGANRKSLWKVWLISFGVVFVCWLIMYLMYFPGASTVDSLAVIKQSAGISKAWSNWHPVIYTAIAKVIIDIGSAIGGLTFGVGLFTFIQMTFVAAVVSYSAAWLYRRGARLLWVITVTLFFALTPVFGALSITLWKDIPFAAVALVFSLYLLDIIESNGEKLRSIPGIAKYILLAFFTSTLRHNGFYVVVLITLILIIWAIVKHRKQSVRFIAVALAAVILVPVANNLFYLAGVQKAPLSESLSVPAQQMARTFLYSEKLTDEQSAEMEKFFDTEKLKAYDPFLADPAKNSINQEHFSENSVDFLKLWAGMLPGNFAEYVRAYLMLTYGYWHPGEKTAIIDPMANSLSEIDIEKTNYIEKLTGLSLSDFDIEFFDFISIGTMIWIMLFLACLLIIKKQYVRLWVFLPVLGVWLTQLLATPLYCGFRYILLLPLMLPVLIYAALEKPNGEMKSTALQDNPTGER